MRIGILGGSFNPVHCQHIQMALVAREQFKLDEVWFVPVFQPVHKPEEMLLHYEARRELLFAAIKDCSGLTICDIERELGGASYTVRTVEVLQKRFPDNTFWLIIGGDSLKELHGWREIERLAEMVEFIVIARPGYHRSSSVAAARLHWADCEMSPVSASEIRRRIQQHDFAGIQLKPATLSCILYNDYYDSLGEPYRRWFEVISERLRKLPKGLFEHIMTVAILAVQYGQEAGLDPRLAFLAGLSHDLFRAANNEEIFAFAEFCGTPLSDLERQTPMLAHGAAAAGFLRKRIPKISSDIVDAVRWHTFPADDALLLTKVLVMADTLEPSRGMEERLALLRANLPVKVRYRRVLELKRKTACRF